jgi:hypothetical protein
MAGEYLVWYDSTGTSIVTSFATAFDADPGAGATAQTYRLYNDKGGGASAPTETGWSLAVLAAPTTADRLESEGNEFTEDKFMRAKITSSGEGDPTDYIDMGPGSRLPLPDLPSDTFVEVSFSPLADASSTEAAWAFSIRLEQGYEALDLGHFESFGSGVMSGVGDSQANFILETSDVVQNPAAADDQVQIQDTRYIYEGVPYQLLQQLISIGTQDSAAETPPAGESFYWAITLKNGSTTVTKGLNATSPTKPDLPDGEPLLTWGTQDNTGDILDSMIDQGWVLGRFGYTSGGLSATIGIGTGVINNGLVDFDSVSTVSLTASDDNYIFVNRNRTIGKNLTGVPPQERSMPIWKLTTDGSGVTAAEDLRRIVGSDIQHMTLPFDTLSSGGGDFSIPAVWPHTRTGYIMGVALMLYGTGSGTGSNLFDINRIPAGVATQTTIFTTQATEDRRPTVASAASDPHDMTALPEVLSLDYGDSLIGESDDIPVTTQPTSAVLLITVEMA